MTPADEWRCEMPNCRKCHYTQVKLAGNRSEKVSLEAMRNSPPIHFQRLGCSTRRSMKIGMKDNPHKGATLYSATRRSVRPPIHPSIIRLHGSLIWSPSPLPNPIPQSCLNTSLGIENIKQQRQPPKVAPQVKLFDEFRQY